MIIGTERHTFLKVHCGELLDLAPNSPNEPVARQILNGENPDLSSLKVNKPLSATRITLLHVATLAGNVDAVKQLCTLGAKHLGDKRKWTPLHLSILGNKPEITEQLISTFGEDAWKCKTRSTLTARQIQKLCQQPKTSNSCGHFLVKDKKLDILTPKLFKTLTGGFYTEHMYFTADYFAKIWCQHKKHDIAPEDVREYLEYESVPVGLIREDGAGHGVCILQEAEPDQLIGIYAGRTEAYEEQTEGDAYRLECTSGLYYRNMMSQINHGFPTCYFDKLFFGPIGMPCVRAMDSLKKFDKLYADYGSDYTTLFTQPAVELNLDGLLSFFREHPVDEYESKLPDRQKDPYAFLDYMFKFSYLAHTPSAIMHLIFEDVATSNQMLTLLKHPHYLSFAEVHSDRLTELRAWTTFLGETSQDKQAIIDSVAEIGMLSTYAKFA